jgi:hypothetical protein
MTIALMAHRNAGRLNRWSQAGSGIARPGYHQKPKSGPPRVPEYHRHAGQTTHTAIVDNQRRRRAWHLSVATQTGTASNPHSAR